MSEWRRGRLKAKPIEERKNILSFLLRGTKFIISGQNIKYHFNSFFITIFIRPMRPLTPVIFASCSLI